MFDGGEFVSLAGEFNELRKVTCANFVSLPKHPYAWQQGWFRIHT